MQVFERTFKQTYCESRKGKSKSERDAAAKRLDDIYWSKEFTDKMMDEYRQILGKLREEKEAVSGEEDDFISAINPQYKPEIVEFVDKYIDIWKSMSDEQQDFSTMYMFRGAKVHSSAGKIIIEHNTLNLLPEYLMSPRILNEAGTAFYDTLQEELQSGEPNELRKGGKATSTIAFGVKKMASYATENNEIAEFLRVCG